MSPLIHPLLILTTSLLVFSPDSLLRSSSVPLLCGLPDGFGYLSMCPNTVLGFSANLCCPRVASQRTKSHSGPLSGPLSHSFYSTSLHSHLVHHQTLPSFGTIPCPSLHKFLVTSPISSPLYSLTARLEYEAASQTSSTTCSFLYKPTPPITPLLQGALLS